MLFIFQLKMLFCLKLKKLSVHLKSLFFILKEINKKYMKLNHKTEGILFV